MSTMVPGEAPNSVRVITGGALPVDMAANGKGLAAVITAGNQNITVFPTYMLGEHDDDDPRRRRRRHGWRRRQRLGRRRRSAAGRSHGGGSGSGGGGGGGAGSGMGGGGTGDSGSGSGDDNQNRSGQVHDNLRRADRGGVGTQRVRTSSSCSTRKSRRSSFRDNGLDNAAHVFKLPGDLGYDAGRNVFHMQTKSGLACASCHLGRSRRRPDLDVRRVRHAPLAEPVRRHPEPRAVPLDLVTRPDLDNLMDDVFAVRMGGGTPTAGEKLAIGPFLDRLPAPAPFSGLDTAAVARGKTLFESAATECTKCHSDSLMTNNSLQDVGTLSDGQPHTFKVPSLLGVGARGPWMHDGCATTLSERFTKAGCGGGDKHGKTSQLSASDIADLTTYLQLACSSSFGYR